MNIPGMGNMMKKVQQMQDDMKKAQTELESMEVTGEAGAGLVKVTLTGKNDCRQVELDNEVLGENADKEMLEDLIAAAINDAVRKVESLKEEKMGGVTGGMNIPGMDQLLK
jgi:DNA-binding YbaB/EbfC family protein